MTHKLASDSYVREALDGEGAAPVKTTGSVGFVRTPAVNSPTNIVLTILGALFIWFTVVPSLKFLFVDAVWTGSDRNACLEVNAGHPVGDAGPTSTPSTPSSSTVSIPSPSGGGSTSRLRWRRCCCSRC